jgi:hypothetical protein
MNPVTPPPVARRRSVGWWIALGTGLLLTPLVVLGFAAISVMTLDRDAAFLRREVMAATDTKWHTKVQVSAGWITLGAVRTGLQFIQAEHMDEARLAMKAVRRASVGVYESNVRITNIARGQLFAQTDKMMRKRGWSRLVGVAENEQTVLVYTSDDIGGGRRIDLCVAVVDGQQMVVVSTNVDASVLADLAERHIPKDGLRGQLKHEKLSF